MPATPTASVQQETVESDLDSYIYARSADKAMTDVALGSDRDLHDAVLSVQMESLTFDLAVQVRNRRMEVRRS